LSWVEGRSVKGDRLSGRKKRNLRKRGGYFIISGEKEALKKRKP